MRHLVVIDAYNAMYRLLPDLPEDRDEARRRLVDRTIEALRLGTLGGVDRAHLVFDTWPGATRAGLRGRRGRVSWHYAEGSADEAILDHLRQHEGRSSGTRVTVVTNDRELGGRARQLGARGMGVDAFYAAAGGGASEKPRPLPGTFPTFRAGDFELPEGDIDLDDDDYL